MHLYRQKENKPWPLHTYHRALSYLAGHIQSLVLHDGWHSKAEAWVTLDTDLSGSAQNSTLKNGSN